MIQHHPSVINNKYLKLYLSIINSHHPEEECMENHHVIPKALGGLDGTNIVRMSSRKHFLCHYLLPKFLLGKDKAKMINALSIMKTSHGNPRYVNSRLYESYRSQFGAMQKGKITLKRGDSIKFVEKSDVDNHIKNGWTFGNPKFTVKGLKYCNNGIINKTYKGDIPHGFTKGRIGGSCDGRVFIMKGDKIKRVKSVDVKTYINQGWIVGKKSTNKGLTSISKNGEVKMVPRLDVDRYINDGWTQRGANQIGKEHGVFMRRGFDQKRVKRADIDVHLKEGWSLGRINSPNKGKSAMHKNGTVVYVDRSEIRKYELDGYLKGRR